MKTATHDLAAVVIAPDQTITFACVCGALLSARPGNGWFILVDDGLATLYPSVDIPGHFHAYFSGVPVAKTMTEAMEISRQRRSLTSSNVPP